MKNCSKCSKEKPLFMFHKHTSSKDGLQTYCKPCHNIESKSSHKKHRTIVKTEFLAKLSEIPQLKLPDIDYN